MRSEKYPTRNRFQTMIAHYHITTTTTPGYLRKKGTIIHLRVVKEMPRHKTSSSLGGGIIFPVPYHELRYIYNFFCGADFERNKRSISLLYLDLMYAFNRQAPGEIILGILLFKGFIFDRSRFWVWLGNGKTSRSRPEKHRKGILSRDKHRGTNQFSPHAPRFPNHSNHSLPFNMAMTTWTRLGNKPCHITLSPWADLLRPVPCGIGPGPFFEWFDLISNPKSAGALAQKYFRSRDV